MTLQLKLCSEQIHFIMNVYDEMNIPGSVQDQSTL